VIWYGRQRRFAEVFLLAGWGHLAILVARNIPLYAIVAAPVIAPAVAAWISGLKEAPIATWLRAFASELTELGEEFGALERIPRAHVLSAFGLVVVALLMMRPDPGRLLAAEYDAKSYPAAAMNVLKPSQRIFSNDEWGDYLIYKLWPKGARVYVDGRSDFYGSKFDKEYIQLISGKYDWEKTLAHYSVDTILLSPRSGFATTVKESQHWRVVYDDGIAIVFQQVPPAGARGTSSTPQGGGLRTNASVGLPAHVTLGGDVSKFKRSRSI
jgi:hypothetical protein